MILIPDDEAKVAPPVSTNAGLVALYQTWLEQQHLEAIGSADEALIVYRDALTYAQRTWLSAFILLWEADEKTTAQLATLTKMKAEGYHDEDFLACWMRSTDGLCITIAYDRGPNGDKHETQIATEDGAQFIAGTDGDQTLDSALAFVRSTLAARAA